VFREAFPHQRVIANVVYNEYIRHRHHVHMNATRWGSLAAFVHAMGAQGALVVQETPEGLFIQVPEARFDDGSESAAAVQQRLSQASGERQAALLQAHVQQAAARAERAAEEARAAASKAGVAAATASLSTSRVTTAAGGPQGPSAPRLAAAAPDTAPNPEQCSLAGSRPRVKRLSMSRRLAVSSMSSCGGNVSAAAIPVPPPIIELPGPDDDALLPLFGRCADESALPSQKPTTAATSPPRFPPAAPLAEPPGRGSRPPRKGAASSYRYDPMTS
jgi:hypothetical protein